MIEAEKKALANGIVPDATLVQSSRAGERRSERDDVNAFTFFASEYAIERVGEERRK